MKAGQELVIDEEGNASLLLTFNSKVYFGEGERTVVVASGVLGWQVRGGRRSLVSLPLPV